MKNWKKPIAAVLAGICCVVGMPQVQLVLPALQAAAAETADTGTVGTLTYTLESDRAVITQCDENAEEVVIPSEIEGKPVLEIGEGAFQFCEKLTSVEIPDTVQTIGKNAFWSCRKIWFPLETTAFVPAACWKSWISQKHCKKSDWMRSVIRHG